MTNQLLNQKLINQLNYSHLEYTFLLFFFIIKLYIWGLNPDNWLVQQTESFFHMFWLYLQKKDNRIWVKLYSIASCIVTKIQAMDNIIRASNLIARENSKHFAIPPLVCPQNDVWEMSTEIPYPWYVTT